MKASVRVLLVTAPLLMTACSQIGTGVAFDSFQSAQSIVPVTDGPSAQDSGSEDPGTVEQIPLQPGEVIDDQGNLTNENGEIIVPACDATAQVAANYTLQQTGSNNKAGVGQTGSNNSASIYQKGDSNEACVVQKGDNNKADVQQTGSSNKASVTQTGNNNSAFVSQTGGSNTAVINQSN